MGERKLATIEDEYGEWNVVSLVFVNKWGKSAVTCKCLCGTLRDVEVSKLSLLTQCRKCYLISINISPEEKRKYKAGWFQDNKERLNEIRKLNKPTLESARKYNLKYLYGLTPEDVEASFIIQKGNCFICESPLFGENKKRMVVDHNHDNGSFRGLLCWNCNIGLGCFKDNIESLTKAIKYLGGKI